VRGSTKVGQRKTERVQHIVWTNNGIKVILVDTPGFDAVRESDEQNLEKIATYLTE